MVVVVFVWVVFLFFFFFFVMAQDIGYNDESNLAKFLLLGWVFLECSCGVFLLVSYRISESLSNISNGNICNGQYKRELWVL